MIYKIYKPNNIIKNIAFPLFPQNNRTDSSKAWFDCRPNIYSRPDRQNEGKKEPGENVFAW
ncbi:MAG: hypothetical protein J6T26_03855, partial [Firmicutes bacterium]|nr:hypothetical protein [Bacillota bacterium]